MGHVARAPCMGHVVRAPWDMLRGLHGTCCEGSMRHVARASCMGHVARAPCMGHVARAPWDMLQGLHGTCCRAPWDMCSMEHV